MDLEMDTRAASGSSKMSQPSPAAQPTGRIFSAVTGNGNPDIPIWLLSSLSDLDERMKEIAVCSVDVPNCGDSFAERAESYYRQRPQLLSLLQDIYNAYAYLSDRYIQTLTKKCHNHPNRVSNHVLDIGFHDFHDHEEDGGSYLVDSDAESSLSFQRHYSILKSNSDVSIGRKSNTKADQLVAKMVIKNVEYDILEHEAGLMGCHCDEWSHKVKEQENLLEKLELEREMLLNRNEILISRLSAVERTNFELESEAIFMRNKAGELATKLKEDQAVPRNIEDLQRKISELDKKKQEYCKQLERSNPQDGERKNRNNHPEVAQDCFSFSMFRRRFSKGLSFVVERKTCGAEK